MKHDCFLEENVDENLTVQDQANAEKEYDFFKATHRSSLTHFPLEHYAEAVGNRFPPPPVPPPLNDDGALSAAARFGNLPPGVRECTGCAFKTRNPPSYCPVSNHSNGVSDVIVAGVVTSIVAGVVTS